MISADSPMSSDHRIRCSREPQCQSARGARGMRPHELLPWKGFDDSERNSGPSWHPLAGRRKPGWRSVPSVCVRASDFFSRAAGLYASVVAPSIS
jgi:hypothetical protein